MSPAADIGRLTVARDLPPRGDEALSASETPELKGLRDLYVDDPEDIFEFGSTGRGDDRVAATSQVARDWNGVGEDLADAEPDSSYTAVDVVRVSDHLSRLDHFGANDVMLERISSALGKGGRSPKPRRTSCDTRSPKQG